MELLNPRLTVQNTASAHWLVSMQHDFNAGEVIDMSLLLPRSRVSVSRLQVQLLRRACELLSQMADEMDRSMQGEQPG